MVTQFRDPSNFYTPRAESEQSRGTERADLQSAPSLQNIGAPRGVEVLRTPAPEVDTTYGRLFEGLSKVGQTAISALDDVNKITIAKETKDTLSKIRDNFGVAEALEQSKLEGGPLGETTAAQEGVPLAVNKLGSRLSGLRQAYESGKLSDSYFYTQAEDAIRGIKSKNPGYVDYIDQVTQQTLGVTPANALRKSLQSDIEKLYSKTAASASKEEQFYISKAEFLPPDFYDRRSGESDKPPYTYEQTRAYVAKRELAQQQNKERRAQLDLDAAEGKDSKALARDTATKELQDITNDFLQTASAKGLDKFLEQARTGGNVDPKMIEAARGEVAVLERELRNKYMKALNRVDRDSVQGRSLYAWLGDTEAKAQVEHAMTAFLGIKEGLLSKETGVAETYTRLSKAILENTEVKVLSEKGMAELFTMQKYLGNQAFDSIMNAPGSKLLPAVTLSVNNVLTASGFNGKTKDLDEASDQQKKAGTATPAGIRDFITTNTGIVAKREVPVEGRINTAKMLYNDATERFMKKFSRDDHERLYHQFFGQDMTKAMVEIKNSGKPGAAEAWNNYVREANIAFTTVFKQTGDSINSGNAERRYIQIELGKDGKFRIEPTEEGKKYANTGPTGNVLKNTVQKIEEKLGKRIDEPVKRMNMALDAIKPIMEEQGFKSEELTKLLLQQMGVDTEATQKQDTIWGMIMDGVNRMDEALKPKKEKK